MRPLLERLEDQADAERILRARLATLPPGLAAAAEADLAESEGRLREGEEPRYVSDVYLSRHFDGLGRWQPAWAWDPCEP